jgi:hypothetical protein
MRLWEIHAEVCGVSYFSLGALLKRCVLHKHTPLYGGTLSPKATCPHTPSSLKRIWIHTAFIRILHVLSPVSDCTVHR